MAPDVTFFTADSDDYSNDDRSDNNTVTALSSNEQSDSENSDLKMTVQHMDILKRHNITCNAELLNATKHINFNILELMTRGKKNASGRKQRCGRLMSSKFG